MIRRSFMLATGLLLALASPVLAHSDRESGSWGNFGAGFGVFATAGGTAAQSQGNGQAESFGDGTAGARVQWNGSGIQADGFQTNAAGAITQGNAFGQGFSNGSAFGAAVGANANRGQWRSR